MDTTSDMQYWVPLIPELTVTNLEESLDFYRAAGFSERYRRDVPPFAFIEKGKAQVMLEQQHARGWNVEPLDRPLGRGVNFQVAVVDAEAILSSLQALGFSPFRVLKDTWYAVSEHVEKGQREFLIQDPDGYLMRFAQCLGSRPAVK